MKPIPSGGDKPKGPKPRFVETITLTKEEIRAARSAQPSTQCGFFLQYTPGRYCILAEQKDEPYCRLCKKLTQFAKGERDE